MVFGGVQVERIALNESTFWSGALGDDHENPTAREHLNEARGLMFEGRYLEAANVVAEHMLGRRGNYGTHLPVGDLLLETATDVGEVRDYRRDLDLDSAVATVAYGVGGVRHTREVLASHPDGVIAVRLSADQPGRVSFRARFRAAREPSSVRVEGGDTLVISAKARERVHSDGATGVSLRGR
jgi:alpha-L-fucosidase 2